MTKQEKDHYKEEFGKRLQEVRKRLPTKNGKPFTQEGILEAICNGPNRSGEQWNVGIKTWQRYEQGKCLPELKTLVWLREDFGINLNFLIAGSGELFAPGNTIPEAWETIGERLQNFRRSRTKNPATNRRYTQQEMATLFGCAPDTWRRYELVVLREESRTQKRLIPLTYLKKLHQLFGLDLNFLIAGG